MFYLSDVGMQMVHMFLQLFSFIQLGSITFNVRLIEIFVYEKYFHFVVTFPLQKVQ
jgi:hypothetical protein